jgi:hypothetical protein
MNILSSTSTDLDGESLSVEDLRAMRNEINRGDGIQLGVQHNPIFPPIGQLYNARLVEDSDGKTLLVADNFTYNESIVELDGEEYIVSTHEKSKRFAGIKRRSDFNSILLFDYLIFKTEKEKEIFEKELKEIHQELSLGRHIQKAAWNDPQVIITLGQYFLFYKILKPIGKVLIRKVVEDLGEDFFQQYLKLKKLIIRSVKEFGSKDKPVIMVIQIPSENLEIELVHKVKFENIEEYVYSLQPKMIQEVSQKALHYEQIFDAEKVQFVLNEEGIWSLNYLLSKEGKIVGKPKYFNERNIVYKKILEQDQVGLSYSASKRKIEIKPTDIQSNENRD